MAGQERGRGHSRWLSDATIWCYKYGQDETQAAVGLTRACQPMRKGTASNRNALLGGVHPWTGVPFVAPPVPEFGWQSLPVAAIAAKPASLAEVFPQGSGCSAAAKRHGVAEKLSHRPGACARGGSGTSREAPATAPQRGQEAHADGLGTCVSNPRSGRVHLPAADCPRLEQLRLRVRARADARAAAASLVPSVEPRPPDLQPAPS